MRLGFVAWQFRCDRLAIKATNLASASFRKISLYILYSTESSLKQRQVDIQSEGSLLECSTFPSMIVLR